MDPCLSGGSNQETVKTNSSGTSSTKGGSTSTSNSTEESSSLNLNLGSSNTKGSSNSDTASKSTSLNRGTSRDVGRVKKDLSSLNMLSRIKIILTINYLLFYYQGKTFNTNKCQSGSTGTGTDSTKGQSETQGRDNGKTFEKSYEIPGDMRSVRRSVAMIETENFFAKTSGSIRYVASHDNGLKLLLNSIFQSH